MLDSDLPYSAQAGTGPTLDERAAGLTARHLRIAPEVRATVRNSTHADEPPTGLRNSGSTVAELIETLQRYPAWARVQATTYGHAPVTVDSVEYWPGSESVVLS